VYGPRDRDFYAYFRAINLRLNLQLGQGERHISLIHVRDLVDLLVRALEQEAAVGQTYFGCGPASTYAGLAETIARALDRRPVRINVPLAALGPLAAVSRVQGRLTGRPALLNDQRLVDVRQRSWLYSGDKARRELGFVAQYDLEAGVRETAEWYRREGWL
jgi:nucleoside-diphosphate-sugar epimerase